MTKGVEPVPFVIRVGP